MTTYYRIYDHTEKNTLASGIPTLEQANEVLHFLKLEYPSNSIEIESYRRTVSGLGRDPDLH